MVRCLVGIWVVHLLDFLFLDFHCVCLVCFLNLVACVAYLLRCFVSLFPFLLVSHISFLLIPLSLWGLVYSFMRTLSSLCFFITVFAFGFLALASNTIL